MSKILVTGINGFVGKHLARELKKCGHEIIGAGQDPAADASITSLLQSYYVCDLTDKAQVATLPLAGVQTIISLAGLANVGDSFARPDFYKEINVAVLTTIGERLLNEGLSARVIAISTGAVYDSNQSMPLIEDSDLATTGSPYMLSKIAMEQAANRLAEAGLDCVVARPFNHIGPGQGPGFLLPDLYLAIRQASQNNGILKVGDLTTRRDFTDVRDVVKAYVALTTAPALKHHVYNVCSGRSTAGNAILKLLLKTLQQTQRITIEQNPDLLRPHDPKDLYGSSERLQRETNWQPTIALEQTIRDFVASQPV